MDAFKKLKVETEVTTIVFIIQVRRGPKLLVYEALRSAWQAGLNLLVYAAVRYAWQGGLKLLAFEASIYICVGRRSKTMSPLNREPRRLTGPWSDLSFTRQGSVSAPAEGASVERCKDRRCHQLHLHYCMEEIWQGTWEG